MFVYCDCYYWYRPFSKTLEQAEDASGEEEVPEAAVILVHAEVEDEQRRSKVLTKALKNVKWLANKRERKWPVVCGGRATTSG
jgi:hypothetical protein